MSKIRRKVYRYIPEFIKERIDFFNHDIISFMRYVANEIDVDAKVLDAGAGTCPYKKYFHHVKYESTDRYDNDDDNRIGNKLGNKHDFLCSLEHIPKLDETYDVIINTQVLEHVEYPLKVIKEFHRILKPGGKLFMTTPQGYGVHGKPNNFYNFTKYGLISMFRDTGFKIIFIKQGGGIFNDIGKRIKIMPYYIMEQQEQVTKVILFPIYIIAIPICEFIIPFICFYLDVLDKNQNFTLGYKSYCVKE